MSSLTINIRINVVKPGAIATGGMGIHDDDNSLIPMKRKGNAKEVSEAIMFLLSNGASYISGAEIHITGGLGAHY